MHWASSWIREICNSQIQLEISFILFKPSYIVKLEVQNTFCSSSSARKLIIIKNWSSLAVNWAALIINYEKSFRQIMKRSENPGWRFNFCRHHPRHRHRRIQTRGPPRWLAVRTSSTGWRRSQCLWRETRKWGHTDSLNYVSFHSLSVSV